MRIRLLPLLILAMATRAALAQQAAPVLNGTMPIARIQRWQKQLKDKRLQFPMATASVALYKIKYPSTDFDGKPVTLSGLLELPQGAPVKGLLVYFHGTTTDPNLSPSRFSGMNNSEAQLAALIFASGGYAVAMPDYIGLGDDTSHIHPYPLSEVNSKSGIDMVSPATQAATQLGVTIPPKLYVGGYSEGGGVAMWMVRHVEAEPIAGYTLTAAAPMSGAYDLSGVSARSLLDISKTIESTAIKLLFATYTVYSVCASLHQNLNLYFDPKMAAYVPKVYAKHLSDEDLVKKLAVEGVKLGAIDSIRRILTPRFKEALKTEDTKDPLIAELRKNDCYDWAPQTPMLLPYLTTDRLVPPENTLEAIMAMRVRGVGSYLVDRHPINDSRLDHITAVPYAMVVGRLFFDSK
ncbi:MAG TPA: hypothetical protein VGL56_05560 [Fimbriimonadaceae bacterium]|jgi:pimeloyl-ACP methyl ester carboxylesterase